MRSLVVLGLSMLWVLSAYGLEQQSLHVIKDSGRAQQQQCSSTEGTTCPSGLSDAMVRKSNHTNCLSDVLHTPHSTGTKPGLHAYVVLLSWDLCAGRLMMSWLRS